MIRPGLIDQILPAAEGREGERERQRERKKESKQDDDRAAKKADSLCGSVADGDVERSGAATNSDRIGVPGESRDGT